MIEQPEVEFKQLQLKALGYRPRGISWDEYIDKITLCVNRLKPVMQDDGSVSLEGEKPWRLYGKTSNNKLVSQDLGEKIAKDCKAGKLDFLDTFVVSPSVEARRDPFRITRYDIVAEAESMAPHKLWNLLDLERLGYEHQRAMELLDEYLAIRKVRAHAEVILDSSEVEWEDGQVVTIKTTPPEMAMTNFHQLRRYLWILYRMYYCTEYPSVTPLWLERGSLLRVTGKLMNNEIGDDLVVAADRIFEFSVWVSDQNLKAYFERVPSPRNTKASRDKVVRNLKKRWGIKE